METDKRYVKSPAFQIYPADFLADKNTLVMTAAEVGGYWLLLCVCWRENGLPDDISELADLARTPVKQFQVSWEKRIKRCFIQRADGRWTHNRLEKERVKQVENREKRAQAGAKGAETRWQTDSNAIAEPSPKPDSVHSKRIANDSLSSSSSISTATTTTEKKGARAEKPPPDARKGHPALVAVREIKGGFPPRELWDSIIELLGTHPDVPLLKKCWLTWRTKGYAPTNYGWLVDWYPNGIQGGSNGTNNQHHQTASERRDAALDRQLAVVAELRSRSGGSVN